jgi:hypothetical protein
MVLFMLITPFITKGQPVSLRAGLYDFTDITAREFYVIAPTILAGYDVWKKAGLSLELSAGLSFNSVKYNEHRHNLFLMPALFTINYDLMNMGSKVHPVIGAGLSLTGKADINRSLEMTHYSLAYGYHAVGGLHFLVKQKVTLTLELTYNMLMPAAPEELDFAGLITTFGIRLPVKKNE